MNETGRIQPARTPQMVVAERLRTVAAALAQTVKAPNKPKRYHRLRVAIRRARVVMQLSQQDQPSGRMKKLKLLLRELFRAAGEVRRFDVGLAWLEQRYRQVDSLTQAALETSTVWLAEDRAQSIRDYQRLVEKRQRRIDRQIERLSNSLASAESPGMTLTGIPQTDDCGVISEFHVPALRLLCTRIDSVREAATCDLHSPSNLHQLRIQCKKLRYALEAVKLGFRFDQPMDSMLARMTALQDQLGAINDSHELALLLEEHASRFELAPSHLKHAGAGVMHSKLQELANEKTRESENALQQFYAQWKDGGKDELLTELDSFPLVPTHPHIEVFKTFSSPSRPLAIQIEGPAA